MIFDIIGSLMDVIVGFVFFIYEVYYVVKEIGLYREFLIYFGFRVVFCGLMDDCMIDDMVFWVDFV